MRFLWLLAAAAASLIAQAPDPASRFDVASVKRLPAGYSGGTEREISPTGITFHNATLGNCIEWAWGSEHLLVFGPDWRDRPTDVLYDIAAKTSEPVPPDQLKRMLQTLLADRLKLVVHKEQRQLPILALQVDPAGLKIVPSQTSGDHAIEQAEGGAQKFERVSMGFFVRTIGYPSVSRPIADETGLKGVFDFTLDLARYFSDARSDTSGRMDMESIVTRALPQQLGLRLVSKKAPVEVLVIDSVNKDPEAN